jgi:hypothetical protein
MPAFLFPLVVGNDNPYKITFTSAAAVVNYLPADGPPGQLSADYTNPAATSSGVFGGQVTTLKLNVLLNNCLGPIYFCDPTSKFHGMTIAQILAEMERVLGGGAPLGGTTLGGSNNNGYNYVATQINEAFDSDQCPTTPITGWAKSFLRANPCSFQEG